MFANEPDVRQPQPQVKAAYPEKPWLWLLPDDPFWSDPPQTWRVETDLIVSWNGSQRIAPATATGLVSSGRRLRPHGDTILPGGTELTFVARQLTWHEEAFVNGLVPADAIFLRMPDGHVLQLCVGRSYHPELTAAAASVVPMGSDPSST